jgi:hypothetical protein
MQTELKSGAELGSLANAIAVRKPTEAIGRVLKSFGAYSPGDFVIVRVEGDQTITVDLPMTPEQIEKERKRRSLLRVWFTIMNVPKSFVEIVLQADV